MVNEPLASVHLLVSLFKRRLALLQLRQLLALRHLRVLVLQQPVLLGAQVEDVVGDVPDAELLAVRRAELEVVDDQVEAGDQVGLSNCSMPV